jgi:hypothetical protein
VQIPFSFYTINSYNNILKFNGGVDSITITPGNYTTGSLAAELQSRLSVAFPGESPAVTYSNRTFKLTITKTSAFIVDAAVNVPSSTAATMLGFKTSSTTGTAATGDSALNISGSNYILIKSDYLTKPIHHKTLYVNDDYQSVLFAAPVNTSPGDIITHEPELPIRFSYKISIADGDIFDLALYDDNGNVLDLNGLDWSMQLIFVTE